MSMFASLQWEEQMVKYDEPDILPVQQRELEITDKIVNMELPMADPCPNCGAFRMMVGDWVCYGHCGICLPIEDPGYEG